LQFLYAKQVICQRCFGQERILSGWDTVCGFEIKPVGKTALDFMILSNPEQMLAAILTGQHNVMAVPEKFQADVRAGALQHKVGFSFNPDTKQYGFCSGNDKQQAAQDEKGSIPFMEKE